MPVKEVMCAGGRLFICVLVRMYACGVSSKNKKRNQCNNPLNSYTKAQKQEIKLFFMRS